MENNINESDYNITVEEVITCFGSIQVVIEEYNFPEKIFVGYGKYNTYGLNEVIVSDFSKEAVITEFIKAAQVIFVRNKLNS